MAIARNKSPQPYDTLKSVNAVVPVTSKQQPQKPWTLKRFRSQPPRISSRWSTPQIQKIHEKIQDKRECEITLDDRT